MSDLYHSTLIRTQLNQFYWKLSCTEGWDESVWEKLISSKESSPWNVECYRSTLFTVTDGGLSECMELKIILHRTRF